MYNGGISIIFDWRNYLVLAQELGENTNEAKQRSSISRAYYAAFCSARNYMKKKDPNSHPNEGSEHQYLIDYYMGYKNHSTNRNRTKIAQELIRMKRMRIIADYEDVFRAEQPLPVTAKDVLIRSDRVVSLIETGGF